MNHFAISLAAFFLFASSAFSYLKVVCRAGENSNMVFLEKDITGIPALFFDSPAVSLRLAGEQIVTIANADTSGFWVVGIKAMSAGDIRIVFALPEIKPLDPPDAQHSFNSRVRVEQATEDADIAITYRMSCSAVTNADEVLSTLDNR